MDTNKIFKQSILSPLSERVVSSIAVLTNDFWYGDEEYETFTSGYIVEKGFTIVDFLLILRKTHTDGPWFLESKKSIALAIAFYEKLSKEEELLYPQIDESLSFNKKSDAIKFVYEYLEQLKSKLEGEIKQLHEFIEINTSLNTH